MTPSTVLLEAMERFLRDEVTTQPDAYALYQARIAANLLALLRREMALGASLHALDADFADQHGLDAQPMPSSLATALRDGAVSESDAVREYLRRRSLLSLAIDNPRYSGYHQARERWPELAAELDAGAGSAGRQPKSQSMRT